MATIILRAALNRISRNFGSKLLRVSKRRMRETNDSCQRLHTRHKTSFSRTHQVRWVHLPNLQLILVLEKTIKVNQNNCVSTIRRNRLFRKIYLRKKQTSTYVEQFSKKRSCAEILRILILFNASFYLKFC